MTDDGDPGSAHVTSELKPDSDTQRLIAPGGPSPDGWQVGDVRSWIDAAAVAGMAWLAVLCVGAVCLLAPKLQFPGFAGSSDPVEVITGVVVMSMGLLGVPIHLGGLTISALPLGALAVIAVAIAWLVADAPRESRPTWAEMLRSAVRVAVVFAITGLLLALVFRIRGRTTVAADAPWALLLSFWWCTLFALAGTWRHPRLWGREVVSLSVRSRRTGPTGAGIGGGVVMVAVASLLGIASLLIWIIVALASGPGPDLGWGDAGAAVIYLVVFLPNIVTALVALSMGAPVLHGAQVGVGGELIGRLQEVSLLDRADAPVLVYALLVIPIVAGVAGGWFVSRRTTTGTAVWRPLLMAAFVFALTFAVAAWIGEARVGAGLVRDKGFARVAVLPIPTFAWGMLWASVFGWFGSELAIRKARR